MKNKIIILIFLVIICIAIYVFFTSIKKDPEKEVKKEINVVPTMDDNLSTDTCWCGTFQIVWNDMKNEVVKKDIIFTPQEKMADNLNKETFTKDMISDEYYYKAYGIKTLDLKKQIEKGIREKFGQRSDILDSFDWTEEDKTTSDNLRQYIFYVMLYRKFEFLKEFNSLENGIFADQYNDVEYFGITQNTEEVGSQIDVLYYNSQDDFAVILNTKTADEVIFCKNPQGDSFNKIYENMNKEADNYTGSKKFNDKDEFKAPKLKFNEIREYKEFENKQFQTAEIETAEIQKAIQTIKFSLDEKGGEIKSEAGIAMKFTASKDIFQDEKPRYFYVDDTFAIFLREKGREMPYFAGRVDDITKFQ